MAGIQGRVGRNIEKQVVKESNVPATGFKNVRALHEATLNDTIIDITALVAPAAATGNGYAAPNSSDLQKVSLRQFKENVTLRTGATTLIQDIDFVIIGARTIRLETPALAAQVYELIINAEPRVGMSLVDAQPLVATGILAGGATDFNVGSPFKVGQFITQRTGAVTVFIDGVLQQRNISNQAGTAGDYYEVHAGAGLGVIIRFNTPSGSARDISVFSVGALAERPDGSLDAVIDSLAGQIDVIRGTVEVQHGINIPIGAPNNVDLKAFGDRVLQNEEDILVLQGAGGGLANIVEDTSPEFGGNVNTGGFDFVIPTGDDFKFLGEVPNATVQVQIQSLNIGRASVFCTNQFGNGILMGVENSSGGGHLPGAAAFAGVVAGPDFAKLHLGAGNILGATFDEITGFLFLGSTSNTALERLDIGSGRIRITTDVPPANTVDKLYNVAGNLFWNGVQLN